MEDDVNVELKKLSGTLHNSNLKPKLYNGWKDSEKAQDNQQQQRQTRQRCKRKNRHGLLIVEETSELRSANISRITYTTRYPLGGYMWHIDVSKGPSLFFVADTWAREVAQTARPSPPPTRRIHKESHLKVYKKRINFNLENEHCSSIVL